MTVFNTIGHWVCLVDMLQFFTDSQLFIYGQINLTSAYD